MNWTAKDARRSREYTCRILQLVDEGVLDKDALIQDLLGWMSEADVKAFCNANLRDVLEQDEDEEDDE